MSAASDTAATTAAYYYDVVIAGAGPAGLTAALFAARAGLSVLVLGSSVGALSEAGQLDNFPSFTTTSEKGGGAGAAWLAMTRQQAAAAGVQFAAPGLLVSRLVVMPSQQQQQQQQHDQYVSGARGIVNILDVRCKQQQQQSTRGTGSIRHYRDRSHRQALGFAI